MMSEEDSYYPSYRARKRVADLASRGARTRAYDLMRDPSVDAYKASIINQVLGANSFNRANPNFRHHFGSGLYTGSGGYKRTFRNFGRRLLNHGADVATRSASRFLGMGSYSTNGGMDVSNSLVDGPQSRPNLISYAVDDENGSIMITNQEYLGSIFAPSNSNFNVETKSINPGLPTFPLLSQLASDFEQYEFTQVLFEFRPMLSEAVSQTGQVGTVLMATRYNNSSEPFSDVKDMLNISGSMSAKASESMTCGVECDPSKISNPGLRLVRCGPLSASNTSSTDIMEYDWAKFFIGLNNFPAQLFNQQIGELYVSYTVRLSKLRRYSGDGKTSLASYYTTSYPSRFRISNWLSNPSLSTASNNPIRLHAASNNLDILVKGPWDFDTSISSFGTNFTQAACDANFQNHPNGIPIAGVSWNSGNSSVALPSSSHLYFYNFIFPPNTTGQFTFRVTCSDGVGNDGPILQAAPWMNNRSGQVFPLTNIYGGPQGPVSYGRYGTSYSNGSGGTVVFGSFQLKSSVGGVDNSLTLGIIIPGGSATAGMTVASVSFVQHNPLFQASPTDSRILWVDDNDVKTIPLIA